MFIIGFLCLNMLTYTNTIVLQLPAVFHIVMYYSCLFDWNSQPSSQVFGLFHFSRRLTQPVFPNFTLKNQHLLIYEAPIML